MPGRLAVMGGLSLIFWSLIIVVTVKYVGLIMRADNNGEGGVLALATLAHTLARTDAARSRSSSASPPYWGWRFSMATEC